MNKISPLNDAAYKTLCKAQRADTKDWVEGYYKYVNGEHQLVLKNELDLTLTEENICSIIPETLCKFTNVVDSNGIKIFENDTGTVMTPCAAFPLENSKIYWDEENFCWAFENYFTYINSTKIIKEPLSKAKFIEISGNIFDTVN